MQLGLLIAFFTKCYFEMPDVAIASLPCKLESPEHDIIHYLRPNLCLDRSSNGRRNTVVHYSDLPMVTADNDWFPRV